MAVLASPNVGVRRRALLKNFSVLVAPLLAKHFGVALARRRINLMHGRGDMIDVID